MKQNMNGEPKKVSFSQKIWNLIKKSPIITLLIIALLGCIIWANFRIYNDRQQYEKESLELTEKYEFKLDSLELHSLAFSSKVFSWSVRSELLRQNVENLNQLCTVYVKESNASLVQIVNLVDNTITISSDKQYEGNSFVLPSYINIDEQRSMVTDSKVTIYTPVMGYNNTIGLLIVEISKNK